MSFEPRHSQCANIIYIHTNTAHTYRVTSSKSVRIGLFCAPHIRSCITGNQIRECVETCCSSAASRSHGLTRGLSTNQTCPCAVGCLATSETWAASVTHSAPSAVGCSGTLPLCFVPQHAQQATLTSDGVASAPCCPRGCRQAALFSFQSASHHTVTVLSSDKPASAGRTSAVCRPWPAQRSCRWEAQGTVSRVSLLGRSLLKTTRSVTNAKLKKMQQKQASTCRQQLDQLLYPQLVSFWQTTAALALLLAKADML